MSVLREFDELLAGKREARVRREVELLFREVERRGSVRRR